MFACLTSDFFQVGICVLNRPFPSSSGPLYQNEFKCSAFDREMISHSRANMIHFHKKGCAIPRFENEGFWNSELAYLEFLWLLDESKETKKTNILRQNPSCLTGFCVQSKTQRILFLV